MLDKRDQDQISKWFNLQLILKDAVSLRTSVNLRREQTIAQFEAKCYKIYKKKIKIREITEYNRKIIERISQKFSFNPSKIQLLSSQDNLSKGEEIEKFLTEFRYNNCLMLHLIDSLNRDESDIMVPFLCHFFYENLYSESTEQIEILYIIYLLLEKEIDGLNTLSIGSFLDDSFIAKFLIEFTNRYEVKCYLNKILKELIIGLENNTTNYIELDMKIWLTQKEDMQSESIRQTITFMSSKSKNNINFPQKIDPSYHRTHSLKVDIINAKQKGIEEIYKEIDKSFTEKKMRKMYSTSDGFKKSFLLSQLKRIKNQSDLFSTAKFSEACKYLPDTEFLEDYQIGFRMITGFLSQLLSNLLDNLTIMPYSIKCICKMIKMLVENKFKNISEVDLNSFVCVFLFGKLIVPILFNPDINDFGSETIISMTTRRNLQTIEKVMNMLIKGKLFTSASEPHFTVFNNFITNSAIKIDTLIKIITNVSLPNKLHKLAINFYNTDDLLLPFVLDNSTRNHNDINYEYFKENPYDFVQHQSICFEINHLNLLIEKVEQNKEVFKKQTSEAFMHSWQQVYEFIGYYQNLMKNQKDRRKFYVITKDKYKEKVKKLLFSKEQAITLGQNADSDYAKEMKYCIGYLLSAMQLQNNCTWVKECLNTPSTFNQIHRYNEYYDENDNRNKVPLSWYSLYVITNLSKMKSNYKVNDYKLLYDEIKNEVNDKIELMKKLNNFLTIQITSKFTCIDNNIKIAKKELKMINKTKFNIELEQFIETAKIPVCIFEVSEAISLLNKNSVKDMCGITYENDKEINVQLEMNCIHKLRPYDRKKEMVCEKHCLTINDFILVFSSFDTIKKDLIKNTNYAKPNQALNQYREIITKSYSDIEQIVSIKNRPQKKKSIDINTVKEDNEVNEYDKPLDEIVNYILKKSYDKLYPREGISEDKLFYQSCVKTQWIDPVKHMRILPVIHNKNLFDKLKEYIIKFETEKTPLDKLCALSKETHLILSLIQFMTNNKNVQADDLLPIIIYSIIIAKPQRMISSHRWIQRFMTDNTTLSDLGYMSTHVECSIQFISNITAKVLNISQKEFDEKCSNKNAFKK